MLYQISIDEYYIAVHNCKDISLWFYEGTWLVVFITIEIFFTIDFVLQFFEVPINMSGATLTKTTKNYMKQLFLPDLIATIISNILILVDQDLLFWGIGLKLFRCFRFGYIKRSSQHISNFLARKAP